MRENANSFSCFDTWTIESHTIGVKQMKMRINLRGIFKICSNNFWF